MPERRAEPVDLFAESLREGYRRLQRPWHEIAATGFIGALAVLIGSLAADTAAGLLHEGGVAKPAAHLAGALFFPFGFFILVQVRAELFTENFLVPVNATLEGLCGFGRLLRLWIGTLIANIVAGIALARVVTIPGVFPDSVRMQFIAGAEQRMAQPLPALLASALLAGVLITLMTMATLRESGGAWIVVFAAGFLLSAGTVQHVIVSAVDIWLGIWAGAAVSPAAWLTRELVPALLANMVGGLALATLPHYLQVYHQRTEAIQDVKEEVGAVPPRRRI